MAVEPSADGLNAQKLRHQRTFLRSVLVCSAICRNNLSPEGDKAQGWWSGDAKGDTLATSLGAFAEHEKPRCSR